MRHTTRLPTFLLVGLLTSCVGAVGGDPGTGSKPKPATCSKPQRVEESITIRAAADFADLPKGCWDLHGKLRLEGPAVTSLVELGDLTAVDELEIVDTMLGHIDTHLPITVWGTMTITGNSRLATLANLPIENADDLTATYTIRDNPQLAALEGLEYIKAVEGDLRITDNAALADISLDELTTVTGAITISKTGATRIDLGSLQTVHRLEISDNKQLTTFDGLAATAVKGDLVLRGNTALTSLGAMSSVTRIEGAVTIDGNNQLANLDALSGLQFITSSLTITNNTALATLGRLSHLSGIGTSVTISGNTNLPYCLAHEIDHCVNSGVVSIANNKAGTQTATCVCWCQPN